LEENDELGTLYRSETETAIYGCYDGAEVAAVGAVSETDKICSTAGWDDDGDSIVGGID
jgi:hypothetical protein